MNPPTPAPAPAPNDWSASQARAKALLGAFQPGQSLDQSMANLGSAIGQTIRSRRAAAQKQAAPPPPHIQAILGSEYKPPQPPPAPQAAPQVQAPAPAPTQPPAQSPALPALHKAGILPNARQAPVQASSPAPSEDVG